MNIQNLQTKDPFADLQLNTEGDSQIIHIRLQQRNGRKTITTVQGIHEKYDKSRILKSFKKEFCCNGNVVKHEEYGEVLQLQGDQRQKVKDFLTNTRLAPEDSIRIHGF